MASVGGAFVKGQWHRKAKWMLKKVLIKPPETDAQMRLLCNDIIERRHGSTTSSAIVSTALNLWDDQNLVTALHQNKIYLNAKERLQRTAQHILPVPNNQQNTVTQSRPDQAQVTSQSQQSWPQLPSLHHSNQLTRSSPNLIHASQVINEVFSCPVCGKNLQCLHDHINACGPASQRSQYAPQSQSQQTNESPNETMLEQEFMQHVGRTPDSLEDEAHSQTSIPVDVCFGPLVLASLAVVGIAVGIFNGEISLSHVKSLSSRAMAAVTLMVQASHSVFGFLQQ